MLSPPGIRRERILVFGEAGSGKSSVWVSVAYWISRTKSDSKVWLLDTDEAYEAYHADFMDGIVVPLRCDVNEFDDWAKYLRKIKGEVKPNDWLVIDMVDKAWTGAQDWYWRTVSGGDSLAEIYLRARSDNSFDMGGAYGGNWGDINRLYDEFMGLFVNMPCHKLALAPAASVQVNREGSAVNKADTKWVKWQYKPVGQKRLAHGFHTLLLARETPSGWNMTSVKEQGPLVGGDKREMLVGEDIPATGGFVAKYLVKVAKWTL